MIQHADQWSFFHKSVGWELHNLPNAPVTVAPLIDTTFHALADASIVGTQSWVFKVSHTGGWKVRSRTPKVSIYLDGGKHVCFNFKVSSRPLYKDISEVFEDISRARFELQSVNLATRAIVPMDEQEMLEKFNAERGTRLRERGLPMKMLPGYPIDPVREMVIDIAEMRAKLRPVVSSEELLSTLPLYGAG